jgi:hypothetical protein
MECSTGITGNREVDRTATDRPLSGLEAFLITIASTSMTSRQPARTEVTRH